jgi:hypothetical protein
LNNELYKLLEPTAVEIEDQDECDATLNLAAYRTKGDAWAGQGLSWQTFDNHIRALYSLYRVTQMCKGAYDYIIYLRPDCRFLHPLDVQWFGNQLVLTDFSKYPVNDRFALGPNDMALAFGERYLKALEFSKQSKLHSEEFLAHCLKGLPIKEVPFRFRRVRADGKEVELNIV